MAPKGCLVAELFSFALSHVTLLLKAGIQNVRHRSLVSWRATECDAKSVVALATPLVATCSKAMRRAAKNRAGKGFFVVSRRTILTLRHYFALL